MSQFRRGLNKNANNPQSRRSVKATSWKARNKTKRKQKRHIKLHERIMTSMRRTRGVPVGRFLEFPGYFDFWFTVFFSFATLSTFYAADLWAETWNDDPSPTPTPTLSLPSLISSPAAVAHFAAWALFMVQHLRSVAQLQLLLQFCWTGLINLESANWFT